VFSLTASTKTRQINSIHLINSNQNPTLQEWKDQPRLLFLPVSNPVESSSKGRRLPHRNSSHCTFLHFHMHAYNYLLLQIRTLIHFILHFLYFHIHMTLRILYSSVLVFDMIFLFLPHPIYSFGMLSSVHSRLSLSSLSLSGLRPNSPPGLLPQPLNLPRQINQSLLTQRLCSLLNKSSGRFDITIPQYP
jgi:hypothetical protein